VTVKLEGTPRVTLLLLEKVSPPLLEIDVGKEILALIGDITGVGVNTVVFGRTLRSRVAVPAADGGIGILFDIKFIVIFLVGLLIVKKARD